MSSGGVVIAATIAVVDTRSQPVAALEPHLRPRRRHRRVGHPGRRRQGQGAQGRRRAGHRLRRGRARLPHARPHRRGGRRRLPTAQPPRYTPAAGLPELREAIAAKTKRDSGYEVTAARCSSPTAASTRSTTRSPPCSTPATRCCCRRPYWTTYPEPIRLAGGVPVVLPTDEGTGFRVTVDQLEAAVTDRTKVLMFVSPSNPTGAVYPPAEVEAIGRWAVERGIWVVTDEIYEHLTYGDHAFSSIAHAGARAGRPVRRAQRGGQDVRHDRVAGRLDDRPPDVVKAAANLQSHATSNVANVSQVAALAAVSGDLSAVAEMRAAYDRRRPHDGAPAVRHPRRARARAAGRVLRLPQPVGLRGAHDPGRHPGRHRRAVRPCCSTRPRWPSSRARRSTPGYARMSFALGDDDLGEGCRRIADLLAEAV